MIRQFSLPRSPVPPRPFPPNARRHQDGRSANWSGTRAAILRGDNASLSVLLIEKVGVGPGADQMQLVSLDAVNQQTLGLDMKLPVTFPDPPQRTIAIAHGQRFLSDQCRQRRPQPGQVLAPPLRSPHVALEVRPWRASWCLCRSGHVRQYRHSSAAPSRRSADVVTNTGHCEGHAGAPTLLGQDHPTDGQDPESLARPDVRPDRRL